MDTISIGGVRISSAPTIKHQLLILALLLMPTFSPESFNNINSNPRASFANFDLNHGIRLAKASYLEDAGKLSYMLNELIDKLLEKISFLADIVIESSTKEHCVPISCEDTTIINTNNMGKFDDRSGSPILDELEYDNSALYLRQFADRMKILESEKENGKGRASCKLFNLALGRRDLPVSDMEVCCTKYEICYSNCSSKKLDCDLQFRECLNFVCKSKFDYTNSTLASKYRRSIQFEAPEALDDEEDSEEEIDDFDMVKNDIDEGRSNDDTIESGLGVKERSKRKRKRRNWDPNNVNLGEGEEGGEEHGQDIHEDREPLNPRETRQMKDKYKACKLANKILIIGNLAFGCQTYKQTQWISCCNNKTTTINNNINARSDNNNKDRDTSETNNSISKSSSHVDEVSP